MGTIQLPFEEEKEWEFLHRYSFLSERHKLLYIATPKVACTSLKWWFASIEGLLSKVQGFSATSAHLETDPEMMIHQALYCLEPKVTGLAPEKLIEALTSSRYFRFALVRNPYKRIFSAWQSKLLLREPLQADMYKNCDFFNMPIESSDDIASAFEGFLEYLADYEAHNFKDLHWTPQVDFLRPDLISYTKLTHIEDLGELRGALAEHLGPNIQDPFAGSRTNESLLPYAPEFVTYRAAELIRSLYADDFKTFGYDINPPEVGGVFTSAQVKIALQAIKLIRARHHRLGEIQGLFSGHIESLNRVIADQNERISVLQRDLTSRDESISVLHSDLKCIYNSKSWRIIEQLRALKKIPLIFRKSIRCAVGSVNKENSLVFVTHDANCAGAQYLSLAMVKSLKEAGISTYHIICGGGPLISDFSRISPTYDISYHHNNPKKISTLINKLRLNGCKTAICNTTVTGWVSRLLKLEGFKVISLVHELPYVIEKLNLQNDAKLIAEFSDIVVFPATVVRDAFAHYADLSLVEVVIKPQGLFRKNSYINIKDTAAIQLRKSLDLEDNIKIVLGCGYADHRKGIDIFVETAINSIKKSGDIAFIWVGNIAPELKEAIMERLNSCSFEIRRKIKVIGEVMESNEYEKIMAGSDVFFLSSREDPFPSVVLDAMNVGVPVVAFDECGGFSEELRGVIELLPSLDPVMAASVIEGIVYNKDKYAELSQRGQKAVNEKYNFQKYVSFIVESLSKI